MARAVYTLDEHAILDDREVKAAVEDAASAIARTANANTRAPVGISWDRLDDQTVRIGPRGAAAVAVEYGSRYAPARRPVKRALDTHRVA